jgi:aminoglycoside 2''-phosphotransferase
MTPPGSDTIRRYLQVVGESYPDLAVEDAQLNRDGQFSHILVVNGEIIFRFPRYADGVEGLAREVRILRHIQGRVTLPIPNPIYASRGTQAVGRAFMGYRLIPGEPLWPQTLAAIGDEGVLRRLARQLALFLKELHSIPVEDIGVDLPIRDGHDEFAAMYAEIRASLFPFMRPDARDGVRRHFEAYLDDPRLHRFEPSLRHGDFGPSNILYDPQSRAISGVIDFGFTGLGDPAQDVAAVSWYGEPFLQRILRAYPQTESMLERARFYRGTYALEEALHGLRSGDRGAFERGMVSYV